MLLLFIAVEERNHGAWKRYPEDIFIRSMLVFTRSVDFAKEAVGRETYTKGPWLLIHASAKWFRLGELEFELNTDNGVPEVHIHIPANAKLTPETLKDTFTKEQAFMKGDISCQTKDLLYISFEAFVPGELFSNYAIIIY